MHWKHSKGNLHLIIHTSAKMCLCQQLMYMRISSYTVSLFNSMHVWHKSANACYTSPNIFQVERNSNMTWADVHFRCFILTTPWVSFLCNISFLTLLSDFNMAKCNANITPIHPRRIAYRSVFHSSEDLLEL